MDWITGIQKAIDYTEVHLLEEIDYETVAKEAYSSSFHFQRLFRFLCGFTLGDYIRMRRLSLAAEDLTRGREKIIDVALRYGYDTPESFSRAFARFHGVTPTEAKRGGQVRTFTPLSVKLILTGGSKMEYRIEKPGPVQVVCKRRQVTKPENARGIEDITEFWNECGKDGSMGRIVGYFPKEPKLKGLLGICFSAELDGNQFPYGIGVEYDGRPMEDEDLEIVTIPAYTYAVFPCRGRMPKSFQDTYHKIVTEFFPQSARYQYGSGAELEVYPSQNIDDPNYYCEIWIAVNEKKEGGDAIRERFSPD